MEAQESECIQSLQHICIGVAASADYWQVQKRHLQFLPEHAANKLLQELLHQRCLRAPVQLSNFRHCVSELRLNANQLGLQLGSEWLAYIADMSHLRVLVLADAFRLKDKALMPALPRLAGSLTQLDLSGCASITRATLAAVGALTGLQQLVLSGSGITSPFLGHLITLTGLTSLLLGGCDVTDDDLTAHITCFQLLQELDLWNSRVGDAAVPYLAQLPCLASLSLDWSWVQAAVPMFGGLTRLDLSACQLQGGWEEQGQWSAAAGGMRLKHLVLRMATVALETIELLEAGIRSSAASLQLLNLSGLQVSSSSSTSQLAVLLLALEECSGLTSLDLCDVGLEDDFVPALRPCSALVELNLSHNLGIRAAGLAATLPGMQRLQLLDLTGCTSVADNVLPVLQQLPELQQLRLSETRVSWTAAGGTGAAAPASANQQQSEPWRQLQSLELLKTSITDAGCTQLVAQLSAAAASQARRNSSSTVGLRKLQLGSRNRLGKKSLAALATLSSLQELSLQNFRLFDADLSVLQGLQQLQQLHVRHSWLPLSDTALQELKDLLPGLETITRDGEVVLPDQSSQGSRAAATAAAAAAAVAAGGSGKKAAANRSSRRGSSSGSAAQRLTEYDERYRYDAQQLLQLRPASDAAAAGDAGKGCADSNSDGAAAEHTVHECQQQGQEWSDLHLIPPELRAGDESRWR